MHYLFLLFGIFCCSTSILFIKIGSTDPVALSAYRLLLGACLLLPTMLIAIRKKGGVNWKRLLKITSLPAFFLGLHFISWIWGGRMTSAANASLIVNMVPVAMPFLLYFVVSEKITRAEGIGTLVAMCGVILMGASDFSLSMDYLIGDLICFGSMLLYAFYLVFGRKYNDLPSIYIYIIPVYMLAGLLCLVLAVAKDLAGQPVVWIGPDLGTELVSILGLAIVPTVFGHTLVNAAFRHIRGQVVSIFNLSQFMFAGILAYLLLDEIPVLLFYVASLLVVIGAYITLKSRKST